MKKSCLLVCLIFFYGSSVSASNIKAMLKSMGETFGMPPVGYVYSYEVWNDSYIPIYLEQEAIASFMGGFFQGAKGFFGKQTLPSIFQSNGQISKAELYDQPYYFNFYISDQANAHQHPIYKQYLTQLPLVMHDPNIYYYHVYTLRNFSQGNFVYNPQVELLGFQNPSPANPHSTDQGSVIISSQLSELNFFNSSGVDVQVSLTYGTLPYSFTVEKYSHNLLDIPTPQTSAATSTTPPTKSVSGTALTPASTTAASTAPAFSLRPNSISFSFYNTTTGQQEQFQTLKLPSQGFDGKTYTIEIFQGTDQKLQVSFQGLMPGNYDVPATQRARDLTPCPSTFWYQSVAQTNSSSTAGYIDLPGQVWVVYPGLDSFIQSKVIPGQVVSWNLTRPLLSQSDQFVYFIYVVTTDDNIAAKFVNNVVEQLVGQDVINEYKQVIESPFVMSQQSSQGLDIQGSAGNVTPTLMASSEVATLMGNLAVHEGVMKDMTQGVIGYILGIDIFAPKGLGFGQFYYVLAPSLLSVSNLVSLVTSYLDSSKTSAFIPDVQTSLTTTITNWLAVYIKNSATVQKQVQQFLLNYGNSQLIDATGQKLTTYGQGCLQAIMSGPISLQYPSLKLSTVTNQYVYDFGKAAPDKMPTTIIQLQPKKSALASIKQPAI